MGPGDAEMEGNSEDWGKESEEMCMDRVVGKWPTWKVDLWRRRWPERLFGSIQVQQKEAKYVV